MDGPTDIEFPKTEFPEGFSNSKEEIESGRTEILDKDTAFPQVAPGYNTNVLPAGSKVRTDTVRTCGYSIATRVGYLPGGCDAWKVTWQCTRVRVTYLVTPEGDQEIGRSVSEEDTNRDDRVIVCPDPDDPKKKKVTSTQLWDDSMAWDPKLRDEPYPYTPPPKPIVQLTAQPGGIELGKTATLTWTSDNATEVEIKPDVGVVPANGSAVVVPLDTTTYTITAKGPLGTAQSNATVTVTRTQPVIIPPPVAPAPTTMTPAPAPVKGTPPLIGPNPSFLDKLKWIKWYLIGALLLLLCASLVLMFSGAFNPSSSAPVVQLPASAAPSSAPPTTAPSATGTATSVPTNTPTSTPTNTPTATFTPTPTRVPVTFSGQQIGDAVFWTPSVVTLPTSFVWDFLGTGPFTENRWAPGSKAAGVESASWQSAFHPEQRAWDYFSFIVFQTSNADKNEGVRQLVQDADMKRLTNPQVLTGTLPLPGMTGISGQTMFGTLDTTILYFSSPDTPSNLLMVFTAEGSPGSLNPDLVRPYALQLINTTASLLREPRPMPTLPPVDSLVLPPNQIPGNYRSFASGPMLPLVYLGSMERANQLAPGSQAVMLSYVITTTPNANLRSVESAAIVFDNAQNAAKSVSGILNGVNLQNAKAAPFTQRGAPGSMVASGNFGSDWGYIYGFLTNRVLQLTKLRWKVNTPNVIQMNDEILRKVPVPK